MDKVLKPIIIVNLRYDQIWEIYDYQGFEQLEEQKLVVEFGKLETKQHTECKYCGRKKEVGLDKVHNQLEETGKINSKGKISQSVIY